MRLIPVLILAAALALTAQPAHAGPLLGIVTGIIGVIKGSTLLTAIFKVVGSVVLSKIAAKLGPKPRQPGIKTDVTQTGALAPCSFILGRYATDGVHVCPPMAQGALKSVPNAYLTYVVELGDVPGQQLVSLIIDGEETTLDVTPDPGGYGYPVVAAKYAGKVWVHYYDGTQTDACPFLMAKFAGAAERPWSADMVGRGICYAVVTFKYDREVFSGFPALRFVMQGIRLYDPRLDDTAGGVGPHRWADPDTWAWSENPMVQLYNLHRGIAVAGHVWGGRDSAEALPVDWWFAAMNACDVPVDDGDGGTEPQFRAGYEVFVTEEPAAVAEELLKSALAQVADMGGRWLVAVADAGLPVYSLTDDDLIATQGGDRSDFPAPQETVNAISANYPEPAMQWQGNPAPMLINAGWEAADGRRLPVSVDYPAVPFAAQVQRLMLATVAAERRFLTHSEILPPEAMALDLLDALTWTSAEYGYSGKLFQIGRLIEDLKTGLVTLHMRERDPDDLVIPPGYFTPPDPVSGVGTVADGVIASFAWGPTAPVVLSTVIDDTLTGWSWALSSSIFGGERPVGEYQFSCMIEAELLGASAPKPLVWRHHMGWLGGPANHVTTRSDLLFPGTVHRLTAHGLTDMPFGLQNHRIEVSGRGLAPGETIALTLAQFRAFYRNR